jgi:hypothetical protein
VQVTALNLADIVGRDIKPKTFGVVTAAPLVSVVSDSVRAVLGQCDELQTGKSDVRHSLTSVN